MVYQYLKDNDIELHISKIREVYGRQLRAMLDSINEYFPAGVKHTLPKGGMFLWASLPEDASTRELLELAIKDKVIFVPGDPFYVNRHETNTMRLNFSCVDEETIQVGIKRLANAMKILLR